VIGREGVLRALDPEISPEEQRGFERSATSLREALAQAA